MCDEHRSTITCHCSASVLGERSPKNSNKKKKMENRLIGCHGNAIWYEPGRLREKATSLPPSWWNSSSFSVCRCLGWRLLCQAIVFFSLTASRKWKEKMSNSRYLAASDAKTPMDREIGHQPTTPSSRPPSTWKFTCATPINANANCVNVTVDRFSLNPKSENESDF